MMVEIAGVKFQICRPQKQLCNFKFFRINQGYVFYSGLLFDIAPVGIFMELC